MQHLKAELETAPSNAIMTLDEAKSHVRRDGDDDDDYIETLISVVTGRLDGIDGILGRCMISQSWSEQTDGFPAYNILRLQLMPLISVSSIEYYDSENNLQTLSSSLYSSHNRAGYGYVKLVDGASWPATFTRDDAVKITYVCGYGVNSADIPTPIIHAAKLLLGDYYENRENSEVKVTAAELPSEIMVILRPYVRPHF